MSDNAASIIGLGIVCAYLAFTMWLYYKDGRP